MNVFCLPFSLIMNLLTHLFNPLHQFYCSIIPLYKAGRAYGCPQCDLYMSEDKLININRNVFSYILHCVPRINCMDIKYPLNQTHVTDIKIRIDVFS